MAFAVFDQVRSEASSDILACTFRSEGRSARQAAPLDPIFHSSIHRYFARLLTLALTAIQSTI